MKAPVTRGVEPPKPLGPDAFIGLAGDFVRAIEPHTEADPAAILIQFLGAVGSAVGRGAGFEVEADWHGTNLFVAIVGATASARKGSSWGQAKRLVEAADPEWRQRIKTGLSSAEGLIWEVRDPIEEVRRPKRSEAVDSDANGFVTELADLGIDDKRLLVIEPELASVLERMQREGNALSPLLRQAWDGGVLDALVKTSRATATGAHISLIGHITVEELRRKLSKTEAANGFANRFIWIYATRSKVLPFGGSPDSVDWQPMVNRLREALDYCSTGPLDLDASARRLWESVYPNLSAGRIGPVGAVTARAPSQVRRLAVIYALLEPKPDGGAIVTAEHLRGALEVWRFADESARFVFGGGIASPIEDSILALLGSSQGGLIKTELHAAFSRHISAIDLDEALCRLEGRGLVRRVKRPTRGRPATAFVAVDPTGEESEEGADTGKDATVSSLSSHLSSAQDAPGPNEPLLCPHPHHRQAHYRGDGGRWICGICHPRPERSQ